MVDIGYSGTALAKKLGIKPPLKLLLVNALDEIWSGLKLVIRKPEGKVNQAHVITS